MLRELAPRLIDGSVGLADRPIHLLVIGLLLSLVGQPDEDGDPIDIGRLQRYALRTARHGHIGILTQQSGELPWSAATRVVGDSTEAWWTCLERRASRSCQQD
jgi:hypothetical protein